MYSGIPGMSPYQRREEPTLVRGGVRKPKQVRNIRAIRLTFFNLPPQKLNRSEEELKRDREVNMRAAENDRFNRREMLTSTQIHHLATARATGPNETSAPPVVNATMRTHYTATKLWHVGQGQGQGVPQGSQWASFEENNSHLPVFSRNTFGHEGKSFAHS
ncbi:hypothetical protein BGZ65_012187 [Modicella reniformis]|uniref:Uncharacterized protein n=1 Tax=Modicella reniformis TaxID=1440133 RepID=A0A9P6M1L0_9FUNG|nr:hypothetical protein BGZ65_012187 [Modicella reniformis]